MKKLSISHSVYPESWNNSPTDREFNKWANYIANRKSVNTVKKGGICHIDGQQSALDQAKQLLTLRK